MQLVLVVDTDFNDLTTTEYYLSGLRYRVVSTTKAKKGLEYARSAPPDLLVLGLSISDKESIENIAHIKRDEITKNTPILGLMRQDDENFIKKMKSLGMSQYFVKPVEKNLLVHKVSEMLDKSRERQKRLQSERQFHIEVDRETDGRATFRFFSGLKVYVAPEVKNIFKKELLGAIIKDHVAIDLRAIPEISPEEIEILEKIIMLFGSKKVNLIAGKHLGVLLAHSEIEDRCNLFMSMEEYDAFLKSDLA
ncbi:MAG: response regulator [Leptospiraceae bacterium]|nr:response regulator [Leptospiraceae bacterium]